ncbi:hypothetical protein [Marinobacter salarius]|uniref:hypothetical protein n=1 Tax=Marinobacter salarius TaxID=1420917 RepID=UPI000F8699DA|nr:hypothetical protein [Marinobacter salarius]
MNAYQKTATGVAAVISLIMLLFVPVRWLGEGALSHKFVFSIPQGYMFSGMDLVIQLGIVWGVAALLIAAFKKTA